VDHSSDRYDDVIMAIATRTHNSDRHGDVIYPVAIVFFIFQ
jgi:hypothetical protein